MNLLSYLYAILALILLAATVCEGVARQIEATESARQRAGRYDATRPLGQRWYQE